MKVGLFNECFPPIQDGVSQVMENYAKILHERGNEVSVVTAKLPFHAYNKPYKVRNFLSVPVVLRMPYRFGLPVWMAPFQPVMRYRPDIVHVHSPFTAARIGLRIARKTGVPYIATFHSKYRDDFKRSVHSDRIVDFMISYIMKVYNAADEVWVPQEAVLDVMRSYGYKGKAEVVPNAVDYDLSNIEMPQLRRQSRALLGVDDDTPVFLFVGQIIKEKRVDFILSALRILHDKGLKFKMFYVGKGYYSVPLREQIVSNGLSDCVKFIGQLNDRSSLQLYYAAADLFLFPSLYDNAPLVLREAAVHHTPTILVEGSTSAEVVTDGENGFLTTAATPAEYAEAIERIISDRMRLVSVGDGAASTLGLTWQQVVPEVEDRYMHLINRKQGNRIIY